MSAFLDGLKWDSNNLVVAIAQHVDTGEVLMQAFADRAAVNETLQTGCACPHLCRACLAACTGGASSGGACWLAIGQSTQAQAGRLV